LVEIPRLKLREFRETLNETILSQAKEEPMIYANGNSDTQTATPDKYPQGYFKEKSCKWCETLFKPNAPSHNLCSNRCKDLMSTARYLKRIYGISFREYLNLYSKNEGCCHICGSEGFKINPNAKAQLCIDHCHTTGVVRGLLCHNCNRALGLFKDNVTVMKSAINYLEGATTIPKGSTLK
jgi:hypothetical protein